MYLCLEIINFKYKVLKVLFNILIYCLRLLQTLILILSNKLITTFILIFTKEQI